MSRERDFKPGIDVTPLTSVSAQNIQDLVAFAEASPNKAIIIWDYNVPDIINNPRYTRYLWFDRNTSLIKYYNGTSWIAITGSGGTGDNITVDEIDKGSGANGAILRIHPTTGLVEFAPLDNILTTGTINLNAIKMTGGANGYILSIVGGVVSWQSASFIVAQVLNSLTSIDPNKLAGKVPDSVLYSNFFNEAEWLPLLTWLGLWPLGVFPLRLINTSGATDGQVIRYNSISGLPEWGAGVGGGSGFTKVYEDVSIYSKVINIPGVGNTTFFLPAVAPWGGIPFTHAEASAELITFPHLFGVLPKLARVTISINAGNEQSIESVYCLKTDGAGNTYKIEPVFRVQCNINAIQVYCRQSVAADTAYGQSQLYVWDSNPSAPEPGDLLVNRTISSLVLRCYAYA